jgi:hypothetical protein
MPFKIATGIVLILLIAALEPEFAVAADQSIYPFDEKALLEFKPSFKCKSAKDNPICVARTAVACTLPGARPQECATIGMEDIKSDPAAFYNGRPKAPAWKQRWADIRDVSRTDFCTMRAMMFRKVSADRFIADPPLPPSMVGTHEVLVYAGRCNPIDIIVGYSIFVRREADGWKLTSYSINVLRGDPDTPHEPLYMDWCAVEGCGYGLHGFKVADIRYAECPQRACKYWARNIPVPAVPISIIYPAYSTPLILLPGKMLFCADDAISNEDPLCGYDLIWQD